MRWMEHTLSAVGRVAPKRAGREPVFIVGTGRCGTSLLVRVMNSHSQLVAYLDEANQLWHPRAYPYRKATIDVPPITADPKAFTEGSLAHWPAGHDRAIQRVFAGYHLLRGLNNRLFVKSAMISFMLPELIRIFPQARFIHMIRNGVSSAASSYKKERSKYPAMAGDENRYLSLYASYWRACIDEIDRVAETFHLRENGRLHELRYEDFCEAPHDNVRELAEFMGVSGDGFAFDLGQIKSTNYKVGEMSDDRWAAIVALMRPTLSRKGYLG